MLNDCNWLYIFHISLLPFGLHVILLKKWLVSLSNQLKICYRFRWVLDCVGFCVLISMSFGRQINNPSLSLAFPIHRHGLDFRVWFRSISIQVSSHWILLFAVIIYLTFFVWFFCQLRQNRILKEKDNSYNLFFSVSFTE